MVFTRVSTHSSVIHDGIFRVLKISARSRRDCGCLSSLGKVTKISARLFRRRTKSRQLPLPSRQDDRDFSGGGQHSPRLRLPLPLQRDFCMAKNLRSCRDNCDLDRIPGRTVIRLLCRDMNFSQELSYEVKWVQTSAKTFGENNHGLLFVFSCL